jgi:prepilin peptidase CpaA
VIHPVEWACVGGLAIVAALWDVRTGRIPNVLTFGAAAAGLVWSVAIGGFDGLGTSLLGSLVGLALFFPLFALGGMGGGDVKLLAAIGAWLGPLGAVYTALWGSLAGGVLALAVGVSQGYLREALRNVLAMLAVWRTVGPSAVAGMTLTESRAPRIAYAVPIGIGAIAALWLGAH